MSCSKEGTARRSTLDRIGLRCIFLTEITEECLRIRCCCFHHFWLAFLRRRTGTGILIFIIVPDEDRQVISIVQWESLRTYQVTLMHLLSMIVDAVDQLKRTNFGKPKIWSMDCVRNRLVWGSVQIQKISAALFDSLTTGIAGSILHVGFFLVEFVDLPRLNDLITNDFRADTRCRNDRIERISFLRHGHFQFREASTDFRRVLLRITDCIDEDLLNIDALIDRQLNQF